MTFEIGALLSEMEKRGVKPDQVQCRAPSVSILMCGSRRS